MKKYLAFFTLLLSVAVLFYSCRCSCNCSYGSRCRVLTVLNKTGNIIETKKYCTTLKDEDLQWLADSVASYKSRRHTDSTTVSEEEIVTVEKKADDVKCNKSQELVVAGYRCECAK